MFLEGSFRSFLAGNIFGLLWGFSGVIGRRLLQIFFAVCVIVVIVFIVFEGMDDVVSLFEWMFDQLLNYVYFAMGVVNGMLISYRRT